MSQLLDPTSLQRNPPIPPASENKKAGCFQCMSWTKKVIEPVSDIFTSLQNYNNRHQSITNRAFSCSNNEIDLHTPISQLKQETSNGCFTAFSHSTLLPGISLLFTNASLLLVRSPFTISLFAIKLISGIFALCSVEKAQRVFNKTLQFETMYNFTIPDVLKNIYNLPKGILLSIPLLGHHVAFLYDHAAKLIQSAISSVLSCIRLCKQDASPTKNPPKAFEQQSSDQIEDLSSIIQSRKYKSLEALLNSQGAFVKNHALSWLKLEKHSSYMQRLLRLNSKNEFSHASSIRREFKAYKKIQTILQNKKQINHSADQEATIRKKYLHPKKLDKPYCMHRELYNELYRAYDRTNKNEC